jgi:hypothetical protein
MGNTASTPPHADVQSGGKKDISYVDYNEANTTGMATTICTYLSQPPLERISRLAHAVLQVICETVLPPIWGSGRVEHYDRQVYRAAQKVRSGIRFQPLEERPQSF